MKRSLAAAALLAMPFAASADPAPAGFVDGYYTTNAKLKISAPGAGSASHTGDGYGVRALVPVARGIGMTAEYQDTKHEIDGESLNIDQLRVGAGFATVSGSGLFVEHVSLKFKDEDDSEKLDGLGVQLRLTATAEAVGASLGFHGQVGYVSVSGEGATLKGLEYSVGGSIPFGEHWGAVLDYRHTDLKHDDSGVKLQFDDLRAGVRYAF